MAHRVYLSPPHMSGHEWRYVSETLRSNWLAENFGQIDRFEREIAECVRSSGAVALNSGTAAIHLALRLVEVGCGDTVFCSSLTFVASVNPVLYVGATPVFIDSEPESWNMSPLALERAFRNAEAAGQLPKAVIVVNIYGQSADMDRLSAICVCYGVPIIEDAAESLGAYYKGKASGTFGAFGIYSFSANKIITASGGGMLVSDDKAALEKARYLATQARFGLPDYEYREVGYNYRMSAVSAAIGRGQLLSLNERVKARRKVFARYAAALAHYDGIGFMPEPAHTFSSRWLTAMTVDPRRCGMSAERMIAALLGQGVQVRPIFKPLHLQPLYRRFSYYPHADGQSVCEHIYAAGLCLPSGSNLSADEQLYVIGCIENLLGAGKR